MVKALNDAQSAKAFKSKAASDLKAIDNALTKAKEDMKKAVDADSKLDKTKFPSLMVEVEAAKVAAETAVKNIEDTTTGFKAKAQTAKSKLDTVEGTAGTAGTAAKAKDDLVQKETDETKVIKAALLTIEEANKAEAARKEAELYAAEVTKQLELVLKAANKARLSTPDGRQLVKNYANQYVQSEITRMQNEADAQSLAEAGNFYF